MSENDLIRIPLVDDDEDCLMFIRDAMEAARCGANGHAVKPHDPNEFMSTIIAAASYWLRIHSLPSG